MTIKGGYDLHVHSGPDVVERVVNDIELAERYKKIGMDGFVIKAHQFLSVYRANLVNSLVDQFKVIGSITLNNAVGGINPFAVEKAAMLGAKIVWFPTVDSLHQKQFLEETGAPRPYGAGKPNGRSGEYLTVLENGKISKKTDSVLEVIKENNIALATGHLSPLESIKLVRRAKEVGINKIIITHASFKMTYFSDELLKEAVRCGAYIEQCYYTACTKNNTFEDIIRQIKYVGCKNTIISTDLGQSGNDYPDIGIQKFVEVLSNYGKFSEKSIEEMLINNPKYLID
ncbi:DUF6282 family protein [Peptoniphilus catoniae]|uniref:DUF6282 family protein n=1 Tax=Peptoniphilus catoniae TaxID=1660341 RepID=UPI0010FF3EC9|nr:DUF6282 family protein [Peptoniphilus catoniae]